MNWARTRSYFPVTRELAYLTHAGVAPISTRVEEALARYMAEASRHGALHYGRFFDPEIERVRGCGVPRVVDRHVRASVRQASDDAGANAASAAGHKRCSAAEICHVAPRCRL